MSNLIKNSKTLAKNKLRKDALEILGSGLVAINTTSAIRSNVRLKNNFLFVKEHLYDLNHYERVFLLAIGKDAFAAASEVKKILDKKLNDGVVLSQNSGRISGLTVLKCTHPNPSNDNVKATQKAIKLLKALMEDDLLILIISGGGSAMLTAPYKISVTQKAKIAKGLMASGADIEELNIVRRHLSEIKGGRLGELAYPATIAALVFSDVVGDDLSTIASGPAVVDHTTSKQAQEVLEKYQILHKLKINNLDFNETPKDVKFFQKVRHFLILNNEVATSAMSLKAEELGYKARIFSTHLEGQADEVGERLLKEAKKKEALIGAGETTVRVKGSGIGGRSQELVLSNLTKIKENQVLLACASDGHDNSDFAGALGDKLTLQNAQKVKVNPEKFLSQSDSFDFFKQVGDGIETGRLESNIADLMLVLTS